MKTILNSLFAVMLGLGAGSMASLAQTDGTAQLEATILNYVGTSGTRHWTVAWVTTESGTFIKTLWKQGPANFPSHYAQHLGFWNTARAGSTVLDGYTSATATTYDPPNNNPIDPTWNCRDASNTLVPDGSYKFWAQYAEDNGQGPYTTSGLLWTKGPSPATTTYPNQGANFSNMRVTWTPTVVVVAPTITSLPPPATGLVGTAYDFTVTAAGTPPPTFTASGLPTGLSISSAGVISGMPTAAGTFTGMITAANGVSPDATQAFSIAISAAPPVHIGSVRTEGNNLVLTGTGPANATYHVLTSSDLALSTAEWTSIATNSIDSSGNFNVTVPLSAGVSQSYTRLRVP